MASDPGRSCDCRGETGHGGTPAGPPESSGGSRPISGQLGEEYLIRDIFLEGPTQVLTDVLRLQEGARCQVA